MKSNKAKKLLLIIIVQLIILLTFGQAIFAETYDEEYIGSNPIDNNEYINSDDYELMKGFKENGYVITSYDVKMDVNEDNTYDITETINAYFTSKIEKHGIIRKLSLKNNVVRQDGTTETNRAAVSNVSVNDEYTTSRDGSEYDIKIGSADKTVSGNQKYIINYTYNIGNDKNKNFDELYFNIMGYGWDTSICNITFSINMPKEFDKTKVGFSSGKYGELNSNNISYVVNDNNISGYYIGNGGILNPNEAISIRLELPQGYFTEQKLHISIFDILAFLIPAIMIILSIILWSKYGKDKKAVETVEFYPPEGLNSLDVGYFLDGTVQNNHVISLLVYLANKGYLSIEEIEKKVLFTTKKTYKIKKLKEYDGNNETEKMFFDGLFKCGSNGVVEEKDLIDEFYVTINKIKSKEEKLHKYEIYKRESSKKGNLVLIMFIINIIITVICFLNYGNGNYFTFEEHTLDLIETIYNAVATFIIFMIFGIMPSRSQYGVEMLGKIKGFKNFLKTAEKDKLERLCESNPTYFYDILPYTYALGVSKVWMDKFETMAIETPPPMWYSGYDTFEMARFNAFMNSTMTSTTNAMTSMPSSSSGGGGGYSGGGFSGGGSGGGGGSSW